MSTQTVKRSLKRPGLTIGLIVIAAVAIIVPVTIISMQDSTDKNYSNQYLKIGEPKQNVYGLVSKFSINYTVISENVLGVFCYVGEAPVQYGDRKSFLVDTNLPGEKLFNITVNIGNFFEKMYYCYVTAKYKLPSTSSITYQTNETAFTNPITLLVRRVDPSKVEIPPTTTKPVKPIIDKASVWVTKYVSDGTKWFNSWIVFHSQYGQVSPNIGFTFYYSLDGSNYNKMVHFETTDASLSSYGSTLTWEGSYASRPGDLGPFFSAAPTGSYVFASKQYAFYGNTVYFRVATTLYGVESEPATITVPVPPSGSTFFDYAFV